MTAHDDREARRRARAAWPIRQVELAEEGVSVVITGRTPSELVAMVEQLSRDAWAMTGKPLPSYARHEMPGRVIRPSR